MNTPGTHATTELADRLRHMAGEAEHLLQSASASGDEKLADVREKMTRQLREMRRQLESLEDEASHKTRQAVRAADHAVHANPYAAIGLAVAAGVLIGLLATRR